MERIDMHNHDSSNPSESYRDGGSTKNQAEEPSVQGNTFSDSTENSNAWLRATIYPNPNPNPDPDSNSDSDPPNDAGALWEREAGSIPKPTTHNRETVSGRESLNVPVMDKFSSMRMAMCILGLDDNDNFSEEYELLGRLIRQIESGITAETPAEQNLGHDLTVFVPNAQLNSFSRDFYQFKMFHSLNRAAGMVYDASEEEQNEEKQATIVPYKTAEKQIALLREILVNMPDIVDGRSNPDAHMNIWTQSMRIKMSYFDRTISSYADSEDDLYNLDYRTRMYCRQTVATISSFNEAIDLLKQLTETLCSIRQKKDQLAQYKPGQSNKQAKKDLNKAISGLWEEVEDLNTRLNDLINNLCQSQNTPQGPTPAASTVF